MADSRVSASGAGHAAAPRRFTPGSRGCHQRCSPGGVRGAPAGLPPCRRLPARRGSARVLHGNPAARCRGSRSRASGAIPAGELGRGFEASGSPWRPQKNPLRIFAVARPAEGVPSTVNPQVPCSRPGRGARTRKAASRGGLLRLWGPGRRGIRSSSAQSGPPGGPTPRPPAWNETRSVRGMTSRPINHLGTACS